MKKQVVCVILTSLVLANSISVFSAPECRVNVDKDTDIVKITADTENAKKEFVVTVLNPGAELEDMANDKSVLQNQRVTTSDADGSVNYSFKLNLDGDDKSGIYKVYITGRSIDEPLNCEFFYASKQETEELILNLLNAQDSDEIVGIISDDMNAKILSVDTFTPFIEADKQKVAQLIFNSLKKSSATQYTAGDMQKVIFAASVLTIFNEGKPEFVVTEDGSFLYGDILGFDTLDEDFDVTFMDIYENTVSTSGKKAIQNALMKKNYSSLDELKKDFMVQTCLIGLTNPQKSGFAHVEKILADKNAEQIGIKLNEALSGDDAISIAKEKSYASIKDLQDKIDSLKKKSETGGSSSGGSSSGKNSGSFGGFTIDRAQEQDKQDDTPKGEKKFSDLEGYEWAQDAIYKLCQKDIINGINDNSFAPQKLLTREQAAKIICVALLAEDDAAKAVFSDVSEDDWFAPFVYKAYAKGIIKGISDTEFGTGKNITRQDFAVMIYRAFGFSAEKINDGFSDYAEVSDYAKEAVGVMKAKGIINGYSDKSFRPHENCTRAEAAVLIYKVLNEMGV